MQQTNKRIFLFFATFFVTLLMLLPGVARADNDPDSEPVVSTIADKLIIQLGPEWAGAEFSLTTDVGVYPGVITVNDAGILTTELGGSSTYTLVCITTPGSQEEAESAASEQPTVQPPEQAEVEILSPSPDVMEQPSAPELPSQQTDPVVQPEQATGAEAQSAIPSLHLVLFIGGVVLCIVGLVIMAVMKRRSSYDDYDEFEEE